MQMRIVTTSKQGVVTVSAVSVSDEKTQTLISDHHEALKEVLLTGDTNLLKPFIDKTVEGHTLATDLYAIEKWYLEYEVNTE